ncbi:MAG: GTP cyclohydrolase I FolE2 [Spirochaetaceae bacterium]|nr:MAG: GTP cyclohydrolase I FolE2 [Spirochaetaceae bacterium]
MVDVQNRNDERNIPLQKVGIKNLKYPIQVLDKVRKTQSTVATVNMYVNLPHHYKGTHMSRFIEVFDRHRANILMPEFLVMLRDVRIALEAERSFCELEFPYFIEKKAPVSGQPSMMEYTCRYIGEESEQDRQFFVGIDVPVGTVCPCSKEISARGAHNQRGTVRVTVQYDSFFWIEDVIETIESAASSGLYSLLKREDEKFVTEHAYDNPVFVEDVVRNVCVKLETENEFPWFSVEAENNESIHNHDAFAYVERGRRPNRTLFDASAL